MSNKTIGQDNLVALTSEIVTAHLSHNQLSVDQVPLLIERVYQAMSGLGAAQIPQEAREPAVPLRASVRPDHVICLDCGRKLSMLKRHLRVEHGLTPQEYSERWNLASNHALIAPEYADRRRLIAKDIGLGRKAGQKPKRPRQTSQVDEPAIKPPATKKKLGLKFKPS